jgi:hypothetical protein
VPHVGVGGGDGEGEQPEVSLNLGVHPSGIKQSVRSVLQKPASMPKRPSWQMVPIPHVDIA